MGKRKGRTNAKHLEQIVEEALMVRYLGEDYFEAPKEEFIKMPENMTAIEYREWRKEIKMR